MRRLLQPKNRMVSTTPSKTACYISILNIIQGDVDPTDVSHSAHPGRVRSIALIASWVARYTNRCFAYENDSWPILFRGGLRRYRWR